MDENERMLLLAFLTAFRLNIALHFGVSVGLIDVLADRTT